jgi:hypothetical protein
MDRLLTILRAAHCRSTHHFFALDALPLVTSEAGKRLSAQFLRHYTHYLRGAKAPDTEFRDFRNHVVHVQDQYWGGAPQAAQEWYQQLVRRIRQDRWQEAAYCAGVLSHYFTDPLMPLHTGQTPRESVVHRPLEWSVTCSYERILSRFREGGHQVVLELAAGPGWLGAAVTKAAELSHRHYDELIDRYDLARGSQHPQQGFDDTSIDLLAGLFGVALTGWARIVERAADECHAEIPSVSLSVAALVASIGVPAAWVIGRITSAVEQRAVRAIFAEFQATGQVVEQLPAEVRVVRQERKRDQALEQERAQKQRAENLRWARLEHPEPAGGLAMSDPVEAAPSIGPKTAERLSLVGIQTVAQLLSADAASVAQQLGTRWIDEATVRVWQDQARLAATVPGLYGYQAQLLVAVGCRDRATLAAEQAATLHSRIEAFAATSAGQRVLRSSRLPDRQAVAQWIQHAATQPLRRSA